MHKTGTTAIQRWLENNGTLLGSMGILAHTPTTLGLFFQTDDEGLRARLVAMICDARSAGFERIIISHEGLSFARAERLALLARPIEGMRARFVLTIRHWNGFLLSRWHQNVFRADSQSFHAMMQRLMQPSSCHTNLRFDILINALIAARFDDLTFLSYEAALQGEGLLPAILAAAGVALSPDLPVAMPKVHESARITDSDVLRMFNAVRAWREGRPPDPLHDAREHGTPFNHVYDHAKNQVLPLLDQVLPDVRVRMSRVAPYVLRAADFAPLARHIEALVAPYLGKPNNGQLFTAIADRVVEASPIELDAFTPAERHMIWHAVNEALDFVRTGTARIGPFQVTG
jgi:hypothetical protein